MKARFESTCTYTIIFGVSPAIAYMYVCNAVRHVQCVVCQCGTMHWQLDLLVGRLRTIK